MSLNDCPHEGTRHGRFSIVTKPCPQCGRQWQLRGCMSWGTRSPAELLREGRIHRYRCECGADLTSPVPSFVDHLDLRVIGPPRPQAPSSDRPAA